MRTRITIIHLVRVYLYTKSYTARMSHSALALSPLIYTTAPAPPAVRCPPSRSFGAALRVAATVVAAVVRFLTEQSCRHRHRKGSCACACVCTRTPNRRGPAVVTRTYLPTRVFILLLWSGHGYATLFVCVRVCNPPRDNLTEK